ncbi:MAG: hypothetical protein WA584_05905 [Pyrinomonadaceae bacterium]
MIFVSFAFVFAFFNSSKIKDLNIETKARNFNNTQKLLVYKVQSVQFDLDSGKLISKIELIWNGDFEPPAEIFMNAEVKGFDQNRTFKFFVFDRLNEPFKNGNKVVATVETTATRYDGDAKDNLYASFGFSDEKMPKQTDSELSPVLFVHGKSSIIKK